MGKKFHQKLPNVDLTLVEWLNEHYPERSARVEDSHERLLYRGGERNLARKLIEIYHKLHDDMLAKEIIKPG